MLNPGDKWFRERWGESRRAFDGTPYVDFIASLPACMTKPVGSFIEPRTSRTRIFIATQRKFPCLAGGHIHRDAFNFQ